MSKIFYFYNFNDVEDFRDSVQGYRVMTYYDTRLKYSCILVNKKETLLESVFGKKQIIPRIDTDWNNFMKARKYLSKTLQGVTLDEKIKKLIDAIDDIAIRVESR